MALLAANESAASGGTEFVRALVAMGGSMRDESLRIRTQDAVLSASDDHDAQVLTHGFVRILLDFAVF